MKEKKYTVCMKYGDQSVIAERFKCTSSYVSQCLHFRRNSIVSRRIRSFALNYKNCILITI